ncbi:HAMP domain-containing sensor histidine kinase [Nocardioides sp. BP30]|uniref:sensor histidine kinase n=1 Tax=Nocardioides sp. BP30 TaxID=3036374 RepID=UPI0024696DE0|nr:HAMP domain-containing sensor histidine kinase [Nocardioides sp. BP30]WGL52229.1 HAMP domain-containing sensor histidine kinase [Nocardioides sp. BP30]
MTAPQTRAVPYLPDPYDTRFFQLIADGVGRMLGFGMVVVSIRDADELVAVAVGEGGELGRLPDGRPVPATGLLGTRWRVDDVARTLAAGEDWGVFRFSGRHEPVGHPTADGAAALRDLSHWHPRTALRAPSYAPDGHLIGMLSVALPLDGRPGPDQLAVLERYAGQAGRAIFSALERQRLSQKAQLLATARDAVRRASAHTTLAGAVDEASSAIFEGFDIVGLRVRIFDAEEPGFARGLGQRPISLSRELLAVSQAAAEELWRRGEVMVRGLRQSVPVTELQTTATRMVLADLEANGLDSLLHIPLGSGERCGGALVLLRDADAPLWTEAECAVGLDIGRDLGQVLHRARIRERQRALIRDLSALDDYQSSLIGTVAARLQGPLRTIEHNLERIGDPAGGIDEAALASVEQGTELMTQVVDALLLLSRLAHPDDGSGREALDLRSVVRGATKAAGTAAAERGLALSALLPPDPVVVTGDGDQLARMLHELLENALSYTPSGGSVTVRLERHAHRAFLTVTDTGIGIAEEDRAHVRTDFFRGAAAHVLAPSGIGLGMPIVERIVRRHDGTLDIDAQAGSGTQVRVTLPAPPARGAADQP